MVESLSLQHHDTNEAESQHLNTEAANRTDRDLTVESYVCLLRNCTVFSDACAKASGEGCGIHQVEKDPHCLKPVVCFVLSLAMNYKTLSNCTVFNSQLDYSR